MININKFLPHRPPFLFVDKIIFFKKFNYILTVKNITISESYLSGHFPSKPIVPGIIIIESLAQSSGLLANISLSQPTFKPNFYLIKINNAKFKKLARPGDQIYLEVKIKNIKKKLWNFLCKAFIDGKVSCISDITCIRNNDNNK